METFNLVFNSSELGVIYKALGEMKYVDASPIIQTINNQIQAAYEEKQKADKKDDKSISN